MDKTKIKSLLLTLIVGILIVFVIALPSVFIEEAIINKPLFNIADLFNYWGGIIGAVVGGIIVLLSVWETLKHNSELVKKQIEEAQKANEAVIKDNQERTERERRLSVLPLITISTEGRDNQRKLEDLENVDYVVRFNDNNVVTDDRFQDKDKYSIITKNEEYQNFYAKVFYISNSGIGTAVNFQMQVFDKDSNFLHTSQISNLKQGEELKALFFAQNFDYIDNKYTIKFKYKNIYAFPYKQYHYLFSMKQLKSIYIDTNIEQIEVEKENENPFEM